MNTGERFRTRLRQALLALGVKRGREVRQLDVAQEIGMPTSTVNRYFRDNMPPLEVIVLLAKALDVDPGWLAFGHDSKAPTPSFMPPDADGDGDGPAPSEERAKRNLGLAREARKPHKPSRRRSG